MRGLFLLVSFGILLSLFDEVTMAADPTSTLTTPQEPWVTSSLPEESSGGTTATGDGNEHAIRIDPEQTFQTMDGFGGCFNELGWTALQTLPPDVVQKVLKDLFDPSGANFNFSRMPIGANDYALSWYSLDDPTDDFSLEHFSLARDETFLIP